MSVPGWMPTSGSARRSPSPPAAGSRWSRPAAPSLTGSPAARSIRDSRCASGVTAGAWKASAGTLGRVPVARAPNLATTLAAYAAAGLFVAGLDGGAETPLDELSLADGPLVLVVGSEGRGLSRLVAARCDVLARIPISGLADSLNAGVAAGIALYEVARLRAAAGS